MHSILKIIGVLIAIILAWLAIWYASLAGHVARVEASLTHHHDQLHASHRDLNLKWDAVHPTGFPFKFMIGVDRPTLSMIEGDETFAVSFPRVTLTSAGDGRYRVELPAITEALYAKNGGAPEHYTVAATPLPQVMVSVRPAKETCGPMTGKACEEVAGDALLISYAVAIPKAITLHMTLGTESRDARFELAPMDFNVPIFQPIPNNLSRELEIFVRVLREALVYKTPGNEVPAK